MRDAPTSARKAAAMGRLAHVLQWKARYAEAMELFGAALASEAVTQHDALAAQLYQHRAKCRLDMGDVQVPETMPRKRYAVGWLSQATRRPVETQWNRVDYCWT